MLIVLSFQLGGCSPTKAKTPKENLLAWAEKSEILAVLEHKDNLLAIKTLSIKGFPPNIEEIPDGIELLKNLETFYFDAVIGRISPDIGKLKNLKELKLRVYDIKELPKEIGNLQNLESLTFSSNILRSLPKDLGNLTKLKTLNLDDCLKLSDLPPEISHLSQLKYLSFSNSDFSVFPSAALSLPMLERLVFKSNEIKEIPESISNLKELREIVMDYNEIRELPDSIGELKKLQMLSATYNELTHLPSSIANIKHSLKRLRIGGNEFSDKEKRRISELLH